MVDGTATAAAAAASIVLTTFTYAVASSPLPPSLPRAQQLLPHRSSTAAFQHCQTIKSSRCEMVMPSAPVEKTRMVRSCPFGTKSVGKRVIERATVSNYILKKVIAGVYRYGQLTTVAPLKLVG